MYPTGWFQNRYRGLLRAFRESGMVSRPIGFPQPAASAAERRARYERDGFVLGERLLDRDRLRELRAEFDRIHAHGDDPERGIRVRSVLRKGKGYDCVYNLHEHSPEFDAVIRDPSLVTMLAELTGVECFLHLLNQVQYKPPRIGGTNGWHRDSPTFPFIEPYTAITAWIALDDATEETGCLRMVPESHSWGDAEDIASDWSIPEMPEVYHDHPIRIVHCPVLAGYVHFHNDRVWHSSGRNKTRAPRRALAVHYIGADSRHSADRLSPFEGLPHGEPMASVLSIWLTEG